VGGHHHPGAADVPAGRCARPDCGASGASVKIMLKELKQGVRFTVVTMLLLGGGYNVLLWAVGQAMFPAQAEGSLIRRADGTIAGSRLIAQKFTRPEYFQARPSGVDFNAASTGGTNYGPSNPDHLNAVQARLDTLMQQEGVTANQVPSEMVTASGAGMDPHIPPAAAELQARRIASTRRVPIERVRELILAHTELPTLGFLGRSRVNVLELNLALDETLGAVPPAQSR
jgi:potassium-transporting ATPase KdpC subunit